MSSHQSLPAWIERAPFAATVCDRDGIIFYMNRKACATFAGDGGEKLIGSNVLDCHPEPARTKLHSMLQNGQPNVYTIEKNGVHKLIYQVPWRENGSNQGFIELSLEIPQDLPHFVRS
jgi:PAS domain S-box-containing protein